MQEISEISKKGVIGEVKISSDGKRIGVIMATPESPSNIYVIDMQNNKVDRGNEVHAAACHFFILQSFIHWWSVSSKKCNCRFIATFSNKSTVALCLPQ
jgi:hypothetical protein